EGRQYFQVRQGKRTVLPELYSDLEGIVQRRNLPVVLEAVEVLRREKWTLSTEAVYKGLAQTKKLTGIRGRWDIIGRDPMLVLDTAHNEDGIKNLLGQIEETKFRLLQIIFGTVADKSIDRVLQILPRDVKYYFTQAKIPRALDRKLLAAKAGYYGLSGVIADTVSEAIDMAMESAGEEDLIVVTGSNYIVADAIK
ncbi:MAG: bifunctional folylpolyglutamate synthase/dihydrofolate synthase, partial [Bacteroidales bacterium]|nr:bifunctional folylpolyglutamate synthase/dihydrofolate synthase [Bacteroidales bacterium]